MATINKKITYQGIKMEVEMYFEKGDKGVHTYSNGDPGYPPTPDEYYIESINVEGINIAEIVSEYDKGMIEKEVLRNDDY